jgi:hypothetical protein
MYTFEAIDPVLDNPNTCYYINNVGIAYYLKVHLISMANCSILSRKIDKTKKSIAKHTKVKEA